MVCLPEFVTATGMITVLPTCALPNATFDAESDICAVAATEISKVEKRIKIRKAGLWGEPRHLMLFALSLHVPVGHGGGFVELCFSRQIRYDRVTDTPVSAFFPA